MQFNLGGFMLGAGLVILHKKNPELLSNLLSPIKSLLSAGEYFSNSRMAENEDKEITGDATNIKKTTTKRDRTQQKLKKRKQNKTKKLNK